MLVTIHNKNTERLLNLAEHLMFYRNDISDMRTKEYIYISQQLKLYTFCSTNQQYVKWVHNYSKRLNSYI